MCRESLVGACCLAVVEQISLAVTVGHDLALALVDDEKAWGYFIFFNQEFTVSVSPRNDVASDRHQVSGIEVDEDGQALEH